MGILPKRRELAGRNFLLLIGIDDYPKSPSLHNAIRDVQDFRDVLLEKFDFDPDQVFEFFNEDAQADSIIQQLSDLKKQIQPEDNLIIYFAGHGDKSNEISYWQLYDYDPDKPSTRFTLGALKEYLTKIEARHIVLISDSCFSRSILEEEAFRSGTNPDELANTPSRIAFTSGGELVGDGQAGKNSPFAASMLEYLRTRNEDFYFSQMAQKVKIDIAANFEQSPQFGTIPHTGHKGGEFKFRFVPISERSRKSTRVIEELKGYKSVQTILKLSEPHSEFILNKKEENKSKGIGFELYISEDKKRKQVTYYLFLYLNAHLANTREYLREHYPEILGHRNLIILLPKERGQNQPKRRSDNVQKTFQAISTFYLDEFIREFCTPLEYFKSEVQEPYLQISNFVEPILIEHGGGEVHLGAVKDWLWAPNRQILVLKGDGGVGKSTVARYASDLFTRQREKKDKARVIFINTNKIAPTLNYYSRELSLYDFYLADFENEDLSESEKLSEELFFINLDLGNILVIIDGLDEVITQNPGFEAEKFLDSIFRATEVGEGKVLITCRSYFWDFNLHQSEKSDQEKPFLDTLKPIDLEVMPFDRDRAKEFFNRTFLNEDNKPIEKAMKAADEIFKPDQQNGMIKYHPFGLVLIAEIIREGVGILDRNQNLDTKLLNPQEVLTDYFLYFLCNREKEKLGNVAVDDQVRFFMEFANRFNGQIHLSKFEDVINQVLKNKEKGVDNRVLKAFKGHSLLAPPEGGYSRFRYDFFLEDFKSIDLVDILKLESKKKNITAELIKLLANDCRYNSSFLKGVKERVRNWGEEEILKVSDLTDQLVLKLQEETENISIIRRAISGLFATALTINQDRTDFSKQKNTQLLKDLFEKRGLGEIHYLHLINFHATDKELRFDFRSLKFHHCYFDHFTDFGNCDFDEHTHFYDSLFSRMNLDDIFNLPISWDVNFHNCENGDRSLIGTFEILKLKGKGEDQQNSRFLQEFFHLFVSKGKLERQSFEDRIKVRWNRMRSHPTKAKLKLDYFVNMLKNYDLLEEFTDYNEKKLKVPDHRRGEVQSFLDEGHPSGAISRVISELSK